MDSMTSTHFRRAQSLVTEWQEKSTFCANSSMPLKSLKSVSSGSGSSAFAVSAELFDQRR